MGGGSWHRTGDRNRDHPQEKEMQKSKMAIWGGFTNNCEKKRNENQRRKGRLFPFECIWSHHFIANRWGNSGWLYFGGTPKSLQMVIAAMKLRGLLLGREVMTNLDSILKSRDITLPTNVHLVKAVLTCGHVFSVVFPVVMYGCESWTIKKPEHWRIDAFQLWCWRRLLRVPWT